jgi:putative MFS transporter
VTPAPDSPDIGRRLDALPFTRLHGGAALVCILAMACSLSEISLSNALSAVYSIPPRRASSTELSMLLSAVYVGAIVGAPLFGWMADRLGRRNMLMFILAWIAGTSAAAAFTQSILQLTLCRGLAGMALGAIPPVVVSFLADLLPPGRRGAATLWCVALAALGPTGTLLFIHSTSGSLPLGMDGWRLVFLLLAGACVLTAAGAALLPESPRFLAARARLPEAAQALQRFLQSPALMQAGPARDPQAAVAPAPSTRRPGFIYLLFALSPWATVTVAILSGAILTQRGFALTDALLVVGLATLGPLLGNVLGSTLIDRIDRRHVLSLTCIGMIAAGAVFVTADAAAVVLLGAIVFGMASSIYVTTLTLYAAELFPTRNRGRHLASAWALNRVGAAIAPFVFVPLLRSQGAGPMFLLVVAILVASAATVYLSPRGLQRRGLA